MAKLKTIIITIMQIALLFLISIAMDWIADLLHLPIPGSILGIFVLFALLKSNIIKLNWIEQGANLLLGELLLFFVPAAVAIIQYIPLMESVGLRILTVVACSTFVVMTSSGLLASRIAKRKESKA